jgi:hypothetical protein
MGTVNARDLTMRQGCSGWARFWLAQARENREAGNRDGATRCVALARYATQRLRSAVKWRYAESPYSRTLGTIWLCMCCMLIAANGECCDSPEHGGDGCEPLSLIDPCEQLTLGLTAEEHHEDCPNHGEWQGEECGCERVEFRTTSCEGCGSYLHGERNAAMLWDASARRIDLPIEYVTVENGAIQ